MIDQAGRSSRVGSPSPYRSQNTRTPSRSTSPCSSGWRGAGLLAAPPASGHLALPPSDSTNSRMQQVDLDGVAGLGQVARAGQGDQAPARRLGQGRPLGVGPDRVLVPVDHQHRAADAAALPLEGLQPAQQQALLGVDQGLGGDLQRPADAVLVLLGRVGLGQAPREEELQEAAVVAQPVVLVVPGPALVGVQRLEEGVDGPLGMGRGQADGRSDVDEPGRPGRGGRRPAASPTGAPQESETSTARSVRGRVQHGQGVGRELPLGVGGGAGRAVRAAVAAPVEGEHPEVAGQVRDLRLPEPGVDDRPGGQEEHGRLAVAVPLPEHAHAVALDVPLGVGVAGAGLLPAARPGAGGAWTVVMAAPAPPATRRTRG